ncbi:hypothetical protein LTY62_08330 [Limosilactobacillus balticus]|uniref:hypothetical protein n=1 Tax=Limosilactobacillus balticus TaxID=2759747 RepID=UPI001E488A72|nr:hypothetical protein [Limosilactobacillus balticus]MCD7137249.1 hypothetical protein [Limosilactobacillus balticus]
MKKRMALALSLLALTLLVLTGCAKKIDGVKVYNTKMSDKTSAVAGKDYAHELLKLSGTTSAPNGSDVLIITADSEETVFSDKANMKGSVKVNNGKFQGYIDPTLINKKAKKGTQLKYYVVAVKSEKSLSKKESNSLIKNVPKKFKVTTTKLSFDPEDGYVKSVISNVLNNQVTVEKKAKTVYAVTPKKNTSYENKISKAMYGDETKRDEVTGELDGISQELKTSKGHITLVLINPENHKRFLYASINGKQKYNAFTKDDEDTEEDEAVADNDGEEYDIEIIEEWWEEEDYWEEDYDDSDDSSDDSDASDDDNSDDEADDNTETDEPDDEE